MLRVALRVLPLMLVVACNSGGKSGSGTPADENPENPPDTSTPPDLRDSRNPSSDPSKPSATPPPATPPVAVDPVAQWKSYRAAFKTIEVNGANPCEEGKPCFSFGRRAGEHWYDVETNKPIPQLMSWTFLLSRQGDISTSMEVPIFADRGEVRHQDGTLTYKFAGRVYREGMGTADVEFAMTLQPQTDGTIKISALAKRRSQTIEKSFVLQEVPNTKLEDMPSGIRLGMIAMKEDIRPRGEGSQGMVCKIAATPGSRFLLDARYYLHTNGELQFWRGIYTDAHYGLFDYALAAQTSTVTVTRNPGEVSSWYYTTFDMNKAEDTEIPIYGIGAKSVVSDFKDKEKFKAAVDKICDDIRP